MKTCTQCGAWKPLTEFHSNGYYTNLDGTTHKKYKSHCKPCYNLWRTKRYVEKLERIFGPLQCQVCKYSKNLAALDFHHVESHTKDSGLGMMKTASFERLRREAEKCVILCANCHREVHNAELGKEFIDEMEGDTS